MGSSGDGTIDGIDSLLLQWLADEKGETDWRNFKEYAKGYGIPCKPNLAAAALTRLIQDKRVRVIAPFGEFLFARG